MARFIKTKTYGNLELIVLDKYQCASKKQEEKAAELKATHVLHWPRDGDLPAYIKEQLTDFEINQIGYTTYKSRSYGLTPI